MFVMNEMKDGELKSALEKVFSSVFMEEKKKEPLTDMSKALSWIIRAASKAKKFDDGLIKHGYSTNPYGEIFECLSDAVYCLIGEQANRFENSLTYITFNADVLSEEHKVSILMNEYKKNRPALV